MKDAVVEEISQTLGHIKRGTEKNGSDLIDLGSRIESLKSENQELRKNVDALRKINLGGGARRAADQAIGRFVSDECARFIAAIVILSAERLGKLTHVNELDRDAVLASSRGILGMEAKSALTTSDIPLPVEYGSEVVELVWQFGQARQFGTVYPLGTGTTKLPRLKTSPAFGFISQSANVPELSPQIEFVTFAVEKAGGLVRIPSEIDADSIVPLGQFLARYIARELAKWEDLTFWVGDGSGTYKSMKGVAKAALDLGKKITLATTKTKPSDITLTDLRNLRAQVSSAALQMAGYYMNRTMEALLASFNSNSAVVYIPNGANGPSLDGFPVRWVDVLPVYDTTAHVSQLQLTFGDPSYQFLGVRPGVRIETSADVFFGTDEIAVRALERFAVGLMADNANAVLQLAAS